MLAVCNQILTNNVKELVAYLNANPRTTYGSYAQMPIEEFAKLSGTKLLLAPYVGEAPVITNLIGERIGCFLERSA